MNYVQLLVDGEVVYDSRGANSPDECWFLYSPWDDDWYAVDDGGNPLFDIKGNYILWSDDEWEEILDEGEYWFVEDHLYRGWVAVDDDGRYVCDAYGCVIFWDDDKFEEITS